MKRHQRSPYRGTYFTSLIKKIELFSIFRLSVKLKEHETNITIKIIRKTMFSNPLHD